MFTYQIYTWSQKKCVAAKIIGNLHFCSCFFGGSPLNFDKEKWYYIYIAQIRKNDSFLPQLYDPDLEPCHTYHIYIMCPCASAGTKPLCCAPPSNIMYIHKLKYKYICVYIHHLSMYLRRHKAMILCSSYQCNVHIYTYV